MIRKFVVTLVALGAALGLNLSMVPSGVIAHESRCRKSWARFSVTPPSE
jgi:hypothetical protein